MKFVVLLSIVCVILTVTDAITLEQRKKIEERLIGECAAKENISDVDWTDMRERRLPSTQAGKCLHACIIETLGFVKDNVLHLEAVIEIAKIVIKDEQQLALARDIATDCSNITDTDRCELAYKLAECAQESAIKRGVKFEEFL